MKTLTLGALMMTLSVPGIAAGQSKTLPGEMVTVKAKVEAIESESRTINLRMDDGRIETIAAPDEMKTFNQIKVGDIVTAKDDDNITVRKKEPGEPDINTWQKGMTPSSMGKPAATAAKQRTITAAVTAIDMNVPSITLKGPKDVGPTAPRSPTRTLSPSCRSATASTSRGRKPCCCRSCRPRSRRRPASPRAQRTGGVREISTIRVEHRRRRAAAGARHRFGAGPAGAAGDRCVRHQHEQHRDRRQRQGRHHDQFVVVGRGTRAAHHHDAREGQRRAPQGAAEDVGEGALPHPDGAAARSAPPVARARHPLRLAVTAPRRWQAHRAGDRSLHRFPGSPQPAAFDRLSLLADRDPTSTGRARAKARWPSRPRSASTRRRR